MGNEPVVLSYRDFLLNRVLMNTAIERRMGELGIEVKDWDAKLEAAESVAERDGFFVVDKVAIAFDSQVKIGRYRADFIMYDLDGNRLAIEIDGKEFHSDDRDFVRDCHFLSLGIPTVRIPATVAKLFPKCAEQAIKHWFPTFCRYKVNHWPCKLDVIQHQFEMFASVARYESCESDERHFVNSCEWWHADNSVCYATAGPTALFGWKSQVIRKSDGKYMPPLKIEITQSAEAKSLVNKWSWTPGDFINTRSRGFAQ